MKPNLPRPEHYSYIKYRKQRFTQIILPVIVSAVLMLGLIVLIGFATFNEGGDVGRWAAISTMWIAIPVLVGGLLVLAVLVALIYLMALALSHLPRYTGIAQDYVYIAQGYIKRGADMVVRPILAVETTLANVREFFGRITGS